MKKLPHILPLLILAAALVLLTCGREGPLPPPDKTPPTVTASVPPDGTGSNGPGFALDGSIQVTFSKEMDPSTINSQTITVVGTGIGQIDGSVAYQNRSATFTPAQLFAQNTYYTVTVDGSVMDTMGIMMGSPRTISFLTETLKDTTPPSVVTQDLVPGQGATEVPVNSSVSMVFSEPVNTTTLVFTLVSQSTGTAAGFLTYSGNTALFTPQFQPPAVELDGNTVYTATVKAGLQDLVGNPMASDFTWTFSTGAGSDITPPVVSTTTPTAGASGVSTTTYLMVKFSEPVDQTTVYLTLFSASTGSLIPYVMDDYDYTTNTLSYKPVGDTTLDYNARYTARVSGVRDLAKNAMVPQDYLEWSFTTGKADTSTAIDVSPDSTSEYGSPVTFTATVTSLVSSSTGTPTGNVKFTDNGQDLPNGTVALSGSTAKYTISTLALGTHTITAAYSGDNLFAASTAALTQTVSQATTMTTIAAPSVVYGANGIVTVTVSSAYGVPVGSVLLSYESTTMTQALSNGTAVFTISGPSAGSHALTATYTAQGNFLGSTASGTLTVGEGATTTTINAPTVTYNANASVTVLVSSASGTPIGSVSLSVDGATATAMLLNANGSATFTITSPNAGVHTLTASYGAQGSFLDSTASGSLTVNQAPTTMVMSAPTVSFGSNGIVTVTVTSGVLLPIGNVALVVDGGTPILGALGAGGAGGGAVATFTLVGLTAGSHNLSATYPYPAGGNFATSSASGTLGVGAGATTTTISAPTVTYGANGTVTVTVYSPSGTPIGNVSLVVDGGTPILQALTSGVSIFTIPGLSATTHTLTASYAAQGNFLASTGSGSLTVNRAATTTAISAPAVSYGSNGVVTVTVSSGSLIPVGNVSLVVDAGTPGAQTYGPQALSNGSTTFTIPTPSAGSHTLAATFAAQGNFLGSTASGTLGVGAGATTTNINAPTVTYNANGSVTVNVSSTSGTPIGSVSLVVDAGLASAQTFTQTLVSGSTTFTIVSPNAGSHTLSATYTAQGNFLGSIGSGSLTVNPATTSMVISAPTISYGSNGIVTVTVSAGSLIPTGNVSLVVDSATQPTQALTNGSATFTIPGLDYGIHTLSATYAAQGNFGQSSASGNLRVGQAGTTTVITAPTITYGSYGSVGVTVSSAAGTPTGSVSLTVDNGSPMTQGLTNGYAVFTISAPTATTHSLVATYAAQGTFGASSASGSLTVNKAMLTVTANSVSRAYGTANPTFTASYSGFVNGDTVSVLSGSPILSTTATPASPVGGYTITVAAGTLAAANYNFSFVNGTLTVTPAATTTGLVSSSPTSTYGSLVTFTATVTYSGTGSAPTGSVTFMDGTTTLGTVSLTGGQAGYSTSALAVGPHSITAVYSGDANYSTSTSNTVSQSVTNAAVSISVVSSLPTSTYGNPVTFTATVSPSAATGTVTFKDGAATLGTVSLSGGQAGYSTSALIGGPHSITATYNGDANYGPATSSAISQTVNKASTTTSLGSSLNPSPYGTSVTFTATVTAGATGTVTFMDGTTTLGTVSLSGTQAAYTTSALAVGGHSITAVYNGDANYATSTSPVVSQTVNNSSSQTVVTSSLPTSTYGTSVTFTATVTPSSATGTVTFKDGATTLGTVSMVGGQASYSTAALSAGIHSIRATYNGDANYGASTSSPYAQEVDKAVLTVTADNKSRVYGAANPTFTASYSGFVNSENSSVLSGTPSLTSTATPASPVGPYTITAAVGGLTAANYSFSFVNGTLTVTQAVLTVTTENKSRAYGAANPTFTATYSGFVNGDTQSVLTGSPSLTTTATAASPVGNYTITAAQGTLTATNYSFSFVNGTLTVTQAGTSTTVTGPASPVTGTVTLTATVAYSGSGSPPTGMVAFSESLLGPICSIALSGGTASCDGTTLLVPGTTYSITATYSGEVNYSGSASSPAYSLTVQ